MKTDTLPTLPTLPNPLNLGQPINEVDIEIKPQYTDLNHAGMTLEQYIQFIFKSGEAHGAVLFVSDATAQGLERNTPSPTKDDSKPAGTSLLGRSLDIKRHPFLRDHEVLLCQLKGAKQILDNLPVMDILAGLLDDMDCQVVNSVKYDEPVTVKDGEVLDIATGKAETIKPKD